MDIRITTDGMLDMTSGDLTQTTMSEDIGQKLYRALLGMPSNIIVGQTRFSYADLQTSVKAYLMQYFMGDKTVNPGLISVGMASTYGGERTTVTLTYKDHTKYGGSVETTAGLEYAIADGSVPGVAFDRDELSQFENTATQLVRLPVVVTEPVSVIEIPLPPATDLTTGTACVFALKEDSASIVNRTTHTFTIPTVNKKRTYTIVNFLTEPLPATASVYHARVTGSTVDYTLDIAFGQITISAGSEGVINGILDVFDCPNVTTVYELYDTHVESPAYPLSPLRGKYRVIFPKPLTAGSYMVQYTGIIPG